MNLRKFIIIFITIILTMFSCNQKYKVKELGEIPSPKTESLDTMSISLLTSEFDEWGERDEVPKMWEELPEIEYTLDTVPIREMVAEGEIETFYEELAVEAVVEAEEDVVEEDKELRNRLKRNYGEERVEESVEEEMGYDERFIRNLDIQGEESYMSAVEIAAILAVEEETTSGTLFYKVDSAFTINVTTRVEARIIRRIFVEEDSVEESYIIKMFQETRNGEVRKNVIIVSDVMDMELISLEPDAFIITKVSSGEQTVDGTSVTEWLWGIKPLRQGNFNLILKAIIKEGDSTRDKIVFDKIINVNNKPPRKYNINLDIPTNMKRYGTYNVELRLREKNSDVYSFEWGGFGEISLDFDGNVEVIEITDDYSIEDQISIYDFEWKITPNGKDTIVPYEIKIVGYTEELTIAKDTINVEKNFKESINRLLDSIKDKWYWVFTTLLLPIYKFIKKKIYRDKMNKKDDYLEDELKELKEEIEDLKEDIDELEDDKKDNG